MNDHALACGVGIGVLSNLAALLLSVRYWPRPWFSFVGGFMRGALGTAPTNKAAAELANHWKDVIDLAMRERGARPRTKFRLD